MNQKANIKFIIDCLRGKRQGNFIWERNKETSSKNMKISMDGWMVVRQTDRYSVLLMLGTSVGAKDSLGNKLLCFFNNKNNILETCFVLSSPGGLYKKKICRLL